MVTEETWECLIQSCVLEILSVSRGGANLVLISYPFLALGLRGLLSFALEFAD